MPSDNSPRVIEVVLPEWVQALKPVVTVLVRFGRNPVGFVFGIISLYISNLFLDLFGIATGAVLFIFDSFGAVFDLARVFLINAFGNLGLEFFSILTGLGEELNRALFVLGPAAPFVVALVGGVVLYGLYRLLIGLLGEIPGGSTLVDLLRLR